MRQFASWMYRSFAVPSTVVGLFLVAATSLTAQDASKTRTVAENRVSNCGDAVSDALGQNGNGMPCWSDIRTVDHWNTISLSRSMEVGSDSTVTIPGAAVRGFSYTVGALSGLDYVAGTHAQAYAGQGAFAAFVRMPKWQMTLEDGGAGADYQLSGAHFAGLNRGAVRFSGTPATRWAWQGGLTNSYGNDVLRTLGPLDYRKVGNIKEGTAEAPVADVVAYGTHSGNLVDEQEDVKLDYQGSRRSSLGFSVGHTLRHFDDDNATVQTERGRAELLHSLSQGTALGLFAGVSRQTGGADCSLAGLGAVGLVQWSDRASVSLSGALDGASQSCGKRVQGTGDLAVYMRAAPRTDVFLAANRDLSGGVVEHAVLLNSASAGVRQRFTSGASLRLTGAAVHFNDLLTNAPHTGSFAEADGIFPLGRTLLEETAYRHYQVSGLPVTDNRNVLTFTLWWSPKRNEPVLTAHR
ncbi:MAG TPA: hypothetical protein VGD64_03895 [Acidisarcina sp.]